MQVALVAATGRAGSRILKELVSRGHSVTALVRDITRLPEDLPETVTPVPIDLADVGRISKVITGSDALISAYGPSRDDYRFNSTPNYTDQLLSVTRRLVTAVHVSKTPRLIVVGNAGSLKFNAGGTVTESGLWPKHLKPIAASHSKTFEALQGSEVNWTYFCPAMLMTPGERTGTFRLGGDVLIQDAQSRSHVSFEDYALAMVNELENPAHERQRFTIGY